MSPEAPRQAITIEEIMAGRSPRGGWRRGTLERWGVAWPPAHGWKRRLLAEGIPVEEQPCLDLFAEE